MAIQCKNGYTNGLTINDLGGFSWMFGNNPKLIPVVYYTSKLSPKIKISNQRVNFIRLPCMSTNSIQYVLDQIQNQIIKKKKIKDHLDYLKQILDQVVIPKSIKPFEYQEEACNTIITHFETDNKAILSLPCGCGKTFTSWMIANKFDKIILISPLKQFAKQNLSRYKEYGYANPTLLIDSEGTRDLETIKEFVGSNSKCLLSVTYKSVDLIAKLDLVGYLIIVDEFHNLSKTNITDITDPFCQVLSNPSNKFLFMSATPRVYELETQDDGTPLIDLGQITYSMSFTTAISNGYICDYKIFLPSIHETNQDLLADMSKEIDIGTIQTQMLAKTTFLFKGLLDQGARKCIVYLENTVELEAMCDAIVLLNEYYFLDLNIQQITAQTTYKSRTQILNKFANSRQVELLLSIRILDECVDIPSCDSIYITYPTESKIRTIQRMCRCVRKDPSNPFKIAKVFIWTNQYNQILTTLSSIKEHDQDFKSKISILGVDWFGNKSETELIQTDTKLIQNYIVGIKEFVMYTWKEKLQMVKDWIDLNEKRPSCTADNPEEKNYSIWVARQIQNYKKCKESLKIDANRIEWNEFVTDEKYSKYFLTVEEKWYSNFNQVIQFIETKGFKPSRCSKDSYELKLGQWIQKQLENKSANKKSMTNPKQLDTFNKFLDDYTHLFNLNADIEWYEDFGKVVNFIKENKRRPNKHVEGEEYVLATWLGNQLTRYKNTSGLFKTNEQVRKCFEEFVNQNEQLFRSKEDSWYLMFEQVKDFIDKYKKRPSTKDNPSYAAWISHQIQNYRLKKDLMKVKNIYDEWTGFIGLKEYSVYFKSLDDEWNEMFGKLKEFINKNNKLPTRSDGSIGNWLNSQKANYKAKKNALEDPVKYEQWTEFVQSSKYSKYFKSLDDVWNDNFCALKEYINKNNSIPKPSDNILYNWLNTQKSSYKTKEYGMANTTRYNEWTEFVKSPQYSNYFI